MNIKRIISEEVNSYLGKSAMNMPTFLSDKGFTNSRSKLFLYHGSNVKPYDFELRGDYDWEDSNGWSGDLPEGMLFLTTDIREAITYGKYVIPCELKRYDSIIIKINGNNPSQVFDRDYGIDLYRNDEYYDFWGKFENSGKSLLIINGDSKQTIITDIYNVIPRVDLADEFYRAQ